MKRIASRTDATHRRIIGTEEFEAWFAKNSHLVEDALSYEDLEGLREDWHNQEERMRAVLLFRASQKHGRSRRVTTENLVDYAQRHQVPQVRGNDPALADFWRDAANIATELGWCNEFDILAGFLGGPYRKDC